ncbi:MAG: hypothetical protein JXA71_14035, partial [Chitinispirillaceae bacterium]|nr:hypothetical protein [Chitinispirillaceae bacterium]
MKKTVIVTILAAWSCATLAAAGSPAALFESGIADWDSAVIREAYARSVQENPAAAYLFKATCWWR